MTAFTAPSLFTHLSLPESQTGCFLQTTITLHSPFSPRKPNRMFPTDHHHSSLTFLSQKAKLDVSYRPPSLFTHLSLPESQTGCFLQTAITLHSPFSSRKPNRMFLTDHHHSSLTFLSQKAKPDVSYRHPYSGKLITMWTAINTQLICMNTQRQQIFKTRASNITSTAAHKLWPNQLKWTIVCVLILYYYY